MTVLPPGTLLQLMYLKERLKRIPAGKFLEIGPGSGEITNVLLEAGWHGVIFDLESETISRIKKRFSSEIANGRLGVVNGSFLDSTATGDVDLVISCMVMEHLDEQQQSSFMLHSKAYLNKNGMMIGLVPASPKHWGIEDEIAGHFRRYTRGSLADLATTSGWHLQHVSGLTYPVSNMLLPISNYLVRRQESHKLAYSTLERTKQSGKRQVKFKTTFPSLLGLLLNETVIYPFYLLQKWFAESQNSLVLYFEAVPNQ